MNEAPAVLDTMGLAASLHYENNSEKIMNLTGDVLIAATTGSYTINTTDPADLYSDTLYNIAWVLNRFGVPLIIIIGVIGNIMSGVVFLFSPLRIVSSSTVSQNTQFA